MQDKDLPIQSIGTSYRIIRTLVNENGATLATLAHQLNRPKSTLHGHLKSLKRVGLVIQNGDEYRVSMWILKMGMQVRNQLQLFQYAKPQVEKIAERSGEKSSIMVEEQGLGVTLYTAGHVSELEYQAYAGLHTPLHVTAGGKAILSELSDSRILEIINNHGLSGKTEYTLTDSESLLESLDRIRDQGYALSVEENLNGMVGCAVAITDAEGNPRGAIVSYGPLERFGVDRGERYEVESAIVNSLYEAVNIIEVNLNL